MAGPASAPPPVRPAAAGRRPRGPPAPDTGVQDERRLAETLATEEALAVLPGLAADLGTDPGVAEQLRREYETHLLVARAGDGSEADPAVRRDQDYTALRLALIGRKRATVLRLRDERRIDDTVLRQIQAPCVRCLPRCLLICLTSPGYSAINRQS